MFICGKQYVWLVKVVQHEQPAIVRLQPCFDRLHDYLLLPGRFFWQVEQTGQLAVRGVEGLQAIGAPREWLDTPGGSDRHTRPRVAFCRSRPAR